MAWEQRGARHYYYRKRRVGSTVRSEYVGAGESAHLVAAVGQVHQAEAAARRAAEQCAQGEALSLDREVNAACDLVDGLRKALLLLAGYHTHKGEWRKQRE